MDASLPDANALFRAVDFPAGRPVVVGVSGGSDSLALLHLLAAFTHASSPGIVPVAVTVDHALRPESAAEAEAVGRVCAALGVKHRTLRWQDAKPSTGLAAAARRARHRLLAQAAREEGASMVLVGHTRDDLAETAAMRMARGTGRGDAGIPPATLYENSTWFVRPMLGTRRRDLRAFLAAQGIGWIDDPTNSDRRYERARTRLDLAALPDAEREIEALARRAENAAAMRGQIARNVARILARHAAMMSPGLFRLAPDMLALDMPDAAVEALRIVIAIAGGSGHLPDRDRSVDLFRRLGGAARLRATLSRALIDRRDDAIFVLRERRGLPEPGNYVRGAIWDGRFRVRVPGRLTISGDAAMAERVPAGIPESLVQAASYAEPAIHAAQPDHDGDVRTTDTSPSRVAGPWATFMPSFDHAAASAAIRMLGGDPPPPLPFRGHNEAAA